MMASQHKDAESSNETAELRLADVVGERKIPGIGGKMLREMIKLPDHTFVWLRVSRRKSDL
jgi:hypothetical protein